MYGFNRGINADQGYLYDCGGISFGHDFPGESTAFLINSNGNYILFAGDTGPDQVEGVDRLSIVWKRIAPLIRNGSFKGIFMEISYTSDQPDNLLFGHLTPYWMMTEMKICRIGGSSKPTECS